MGLPEEAGGHGFSSGHGGPGLPSTTTLDWQVREPAATSTELKGSWGKAEMQRTAVLPPL